MPLFGNTFSPKKTPPRKSASLSNLHNLDRSTREVELGLDYGTPTMNLAGQSLKFENGHWVAETGVSGGVDQREAQRLRRRNQQLEEENNLLQVKVEVLLDMVRTVLGSAARAWLWREAPPHVGPSSSPPPSARWPGNIESKDTKGNRAQSPPSSTRGRREGQ
ncbi:Protein chibby like protein 1 [Myotis davidii]|uniref:Protein chibby like protein 1 n=1 Tax=Myotis davidii TaxID=225400 RepID=L5MJW1_MYODS|nr:Protein chibby like protein 1 [Myotis davidii]